MFHITHWLMVPDTDTVCRIQMVLKPEIHLFTKRLTNPKVRVYFTKKQYTEASWLPKVLHHNAVCGCLDCREGEKETWVGGGGE